MDMIMKVMIMRRSSRMLVEADHSDGPTLLSFFCRLRFSTHSRRHTSAKDKSSLFLLRMEEPSSLWLSKIKKKTTNKKKKAFKKDIKNNRWTGTKQFYSYSNSLKLCCIEYQLDGTTVKSLRTEWRYWAGKRWKWEKNKRGMRERQITFIGAVG